MDQRIPPRPFGNFLQMWGIEYGREIPYSLTGLAVGEAHHTLKAGLGGQKEDSRLSAPHIRLNNVLTINFLNCSFKSMNLLVVRHFNEKIRLKLAERPPVLSRDLETKKVEGPFDLIT